ncbi:MAG: radical SAM family heme chaperone HemW [Clostridia bacterium]|nr:radical SAM family heme chaperone HemW [Clostridia bacterium]
MNKKSLGLYIHIPFCQAKCAYCDFYSMSGSGDEDMARYVDALLLQMEDYAGAVKPYTVDSVFIGGGTPTVLPVKCMTTLIDGIYRCFDVSKRAEFTLEANPATVSLHSLQKYRRAGVNRLSMGLQSANEDELRALSRIHTKANFEASYMAARKAGFENINVDIMYGIPLQTAESFNRTLDYLTALEPEHISMYGLRIEEGTPFALSRDTLILPDEDTEADMYFDAIRYLNAKGFRHYEISNFARPGCECRHNLKYWNCDEYLGLGCAAHSYFGGMRFSFKRNMGMYIDAMEADITGGGMLTDDGTSIDYEQFRAAALVDELYEVAPSERVGEYIMLRLRLTDGISSEQFRQRFGLNFDALYGRKLKLYIDNGFMTFDGDSYAFTPKGMYVSNYILSNILDFDENSHIIGTIADGSEQ